MPRTINLAGQRFGRLIARERIEIINGKKDSKWRCECDCGNTAYVKLGDLKMGKTQSCGCYKHQGAKQKIKKHGYNRTRLYRIWCGMKTRCSNPMTDDYKNYGGRGIFVCPEWEHDFVAFKRWAIINGYQDDLTIERLDVNKGYSPENCTWIPNSQQSLNTRQIIPLTFNGKTQTASEWAREANIRLTTLLCRLKRGWTVEQALTIKPDCSNNIKRRKA